MRILISCQQSEVRHPIPAYDFWRNYFIRGVEEAGHEAIEVPGIDWAEGLTCREPLELQDWRARTWQRTLDFVRRESAALPIDLFLSYLYPAQVDAAAIAEIQRRGVPCVNFFCDNVREFRAVPSEYRAFALHWVPEFEALPMYRAAGLAHVHAPMPCWIPQNLRGVPETETEPPTFIGSADILRRDLFSRASQAGAKFKVCGAGWSPNGDDGRKPRPSRSLAQTIANQFVTLRDHGAVPLLYKVRSRIYPLPASALSPETVGPAPASDGEYFRILREAMVCLGVNRVPTARQSSRKPLRYSRLRDIEAPMLGACYLTEWTEGLERLFDPGSEIETYRTAEELSAKLAELNASPERRRSMRSRAQRRALEEHSVGRSIAKIQKFVGVSNTQVLPIAR